MAWECVAAFGAPRGRVTISAELPLVSHSWLHKPQSQTREVVPRQLSAVVALRASFLLAENH